jgi:hypothetical protein
MVMFFLVISKQILKKKNMLLVYLEVYKTKLTWSDSEKALTWFEAKGKIEQLFKQLNLLVNWKTFYLKR